MQEKNDLFLVLDKIAYDPTGGENYIHTIRSAMSSSLPSRISAALNKQRASITPKPYIILENVPTDKKVFPPPLPQQIYTISKNWKHQ